MKLHMKINKCFIITFSVLFYVSSTNAQSEFTTDHPFELSLYVDFQEFVDQMEDPKYIPAKIEYLTSDGKHLSKKVKVKARGAFRRESCEIPPIRINFNDDNYEVALFDKLGKVKLVNECHFGQQYQQYLIKEYLIYKTYQKLTDHSLKTWFMRIRFIDSTDTTNYFSSYSFIIEDIDDLAERTNTVELEKVGLRHSDIDEQSESLVMLFSYMISNTDLYVENLHNLKLLQPEDENDKPLLVPYDFDFTGLVNADYAFPSEGSTRKTVRDRQYLGECRSKNEYRELYNHFNMKKGEIYSIYANCQLLSKESQDDALNYLVEFYNIIENPRLAKKNIAKKCW